MTTQAPSESLELRLERINRIADSDYKKIQRFYNAGLTIAEAYREGVLFIQVHLIFVHLEFAAESGDDCGRELGIEHGKATVLVGIGDGAERFRPLNSTVRLQLLDCPDVIVAKATKICLPSHFVKEIPAVLNRELGSVLNDIAVEDCKLIDDIIERGSQIVDAVADWQTESKQDNYLWIKEHFDAMRAIKIVLEGNVVYVGLPESLEHLRELIKVFYGPVYPDGSPFERMRHP